MTFQAGNVHEIASLFNLKKKKIVLKSDRIWTYDLENIVYHAKHQTTADLIDAEEMI